MNGFRFRLEGVENGLSLPQTPPVGMMVVKMIKRSPVSATSWGARGSCCKLSLFPGMCRVPTICGVLGSYGPDRRIWKHSSCSNSDNVDGCIGKTDGRQTITAKPRKHQSNDCFHYYTVTPHDAATSLILLNCLRFNIVFINSILNDSFFHETSAKTLKIPRSKI